MARTTRPRTPTGRVIALASGKGGVGKSTLCLALGAVWRDAGMRVALLDLDPQGGLTLAAGVRPPAEPLGTPGQLVHGMTLWAASRPLAAADASQLRQRLNAARDGVDVVVTDLSPALTDGAHAVAVAAADPVLIIARLDAAGLPNVAETVQFAQALGVPWRVVPTFKGTTGLSREAEAFLRGRYGDNVTTAVIPTDARAAEAPGRGAPVVDVAPRAKVTLAVRALADEVRSLEGATRG